MHYMEIPCQNRFSAFRERISNTDSSFISSLSEAFAFIAIDSHYGETV